MLVWWMGEGSLRVPSIFRRRTSWSVDMSGSFASALASPSKEESTASLEGRFAGIRTHIDGSGGALLPRFDGRFEAD